MERQVVIWCLIILGLAVLASSLEGTLPTGYYGLEPLYEYGEDEPNDVHKSYKDERGILDLFFGEDEYYYGSGGGLPNIYDEGSGVLGRAFYEDDYAYGDDGRRSVNAPRIHPRTEDPLSLINDRGTTNSFTGDYAYDGDYSSDGGRWSIICDKKSGHCYRVDYKIERERNTFLDR